MDFTIQQIELAEYEGLVDNYKITNRVSGWITFLKWRELDNDHLFWKSIVARLKLVLENEIGFDKTSVYNNESLLQFIDIHNPVLTPEEKIDKLLEHVRKQTNYDGEAIPFYYADNKVLTALNFVNREECVFYIRTAIKKGLLDSQPFNSDANYLSLTSEGLSRIIKAMESKISRYCFVAMSFDDELKTTYTNAIEPAITETGFIPIRIDLTHIPPDQTINDEIISGIKKARFTIADFTNHKNGVYFEAGYALGKGRKVIYSCKEDQIGNAHFDIRNYQHVLWNDTLEFKKKLIDKIEAYIKD